MKQFTLLLSENTQRPVVTLKAWHKFSVMLDTGALFPIWVGNSSILEKMGAEMVSSEVKFSTCASSVQVIFAQFLIQAGEPPLPSPQGEVRPKKQDKFERPQRQYCLLNIYKLTQFT